MLGAFGCCSRFSPIVRTDGIGRNGRRCEQCIWLWFRTIVGTSSRRGTRGTRWQPIDFNEVVFVHGFVRHLDHVGHESQDGSRKCGCTDNLLCLTFVRLKVFDPFGIDQTFLHFAKPLESVCSTYDVGGKPSLLGIRTRTNIDDLIVTRWCGSLATSKIEGPLLQYISVMSVGSVKKKRGRDREREINRATVQAKERNVLGISSVVLRREDVFAATFHITTRLQQPPTKPLFLLIYLSSCANFRPGKSLDLVPLQLGPILNVIDTRMLWSFLALFLSDSFMSEKYPESLWLCYGNVEHMDWPTDPEQIWFWWP